MGIQVVKNVDFIFGLKITKKVKRKKLFINLFLISLWESGFGFI